MDKDMETALQGVDATFYFDELTTCLDAALECPTLGVPILRSLLERLCKDLTQTTDRHFSGLFPRMSFLFDALSVPGDMARELHGLRRLANDQLHNHYQPSREEFLAGARILCDFLSRVTGIGVPPELAVRIVTSHRLSQEQGRGQGEPRQKLPDVNATVLSTGEIRRTAQGVMMAPLFCRLDIDEEAYTLTATILCYDPLHILAKQVWPHCTLRFSVLNVVNPQERLYSAGRETRAVIEPDYLVDAVDIAECFSLKGQVPLEYLVKHLVHDLPNWKATSGTIVNSLFDTLLILPSEELDTVTFEDLYPREEDRQTLAFVLHGEGIRQRIRDEVREQFPRLVSAVQRLRKNGHPLLIEPFFMSPTYGIQGRLDAMVVDEKEGRRHVVELKSGKPPGYGVWKNHEAQVACYNLLLKSVYGPRMGSSFVLYSREARVPFRDVVAESAINERDLLTVRNAILALEHGMCLDPANLLGAVQTDALKDLSPFIQANASQLMKTFSSVTELEKAYVSAHLAMAAREHWLDKVGGGTHEGDNGMAGLWRLSAWEKRRQFGLVAPMELDSLTRDGTEVILTFLHSAKDANFRPDDFVILYPWTEPDGGNPTSHLIVKGVLREYSADRLSLSLISRQTEALYFRSHPFWAAEHDTLWTTYKYILQSMTAFLMAEPDRRALLLCQRPPHPPVIAEVEPRLDDTEELVRRACDSSEYFLLQGPPGTGKTRHALIGMVQRLLTRPTESLVVLAYTNRAVDEIRDSLEAHDLPFLDLRRSPESTKTPHEDPAAQLRETRVLLSTVFSFLRDSRYLLPVHPVTTIIVDEASQLLDNHLAGILAQHCRFILIGDEKQLPAVTQQSEVFTSTEGILQEADISNLSHSIFERLLRYVEKEQLDYARGMLTRQGRMHQDLAVFVNTRYYGGRLTTREPWQTAEDSSFSSNSEDPVERILASSRFVFIDLPAESTPFSHEGQARLVARFLDTLHTVRGNQFQPESIGVISPYRVQIAKIRTLLPDHSREVTVDTVERFQGSERDLILVSLPINHTGSLRNLSVPSADGTVDRKLNVTLTRARHHLILFGTASILDRNPFYKELLDHIRAQHSFLNGRDLLTSTKAPHVR